MKKLLQGVVCVLLAITLVTGCLSAEGITVMASGAERTFDIGANEGSVTAKLTADGVLTVSGSGKIKDFTAQTAPFADCNVTEIKIAADIKSIGSYTFYNCGGVKNTLTLPKGITEIGDKAFSGDSAEKAPKPIFVENLFTDATVAKKRSEATPTAKPTVSPTPAPTATPAPEPTSAPTPEVTGETASSAVSEPESSEVVSTADELAEETHEAVEQTVNNSRVEEVSSQLQVSAEPTHEPTPEVSSEAATPTPAAENDETKYVVTTVSEQEIGEEIFYPRSDSPVYISAASNAAFCTAMQLAGYVAAETTADIVLDCGEGTAETATVTKTVPVLDGKIVLPSVPQEFTAPNGGELFSYSFGGWTESQDGAGVVRAAGSYYTVNDRTDLYFIANWKRDILAKISIKRDGSELVMTAPTVSGFEFTAYRWQSCLLSGGVAVPTNQEQLPWEDIHEGTQSVCRQTVKAESGIRLYRCIVSVKKSQTLLTSLFAETETEEVAFAAVSGEDAVTKITVNAPKSSSDVSAATQTVTLPVTETGSVYKITDVKISDEINLVLPIEDGTITTLPTFAEGQTADNTFGLSVMPSGTSWTMASLNEGAYILSKLPTNKTEWNSGVTGVWRRNGSAPITTSSDARVQISVIYNGNYESFVGDNIELIFQEYSPSDMTAALSTTVVRTTVIGERTGVFQTAAATAGRCFKETLPTQTAFATVQSAITADFTTEYQPIVIGAEQSSLQLYKIGSESESACAFPSGTKIIMADMSTAGAYKYYYYTAESNEKSVALSKFTGYAGPSSTEIRINEHLRFSVDFSTATDTGLVPGNYNLMLKHSAEKEPDWKKASFSVSSIWDSNCTLSFNANTAGSVWTVDLTANVSQVDTRYVDGGNVHIKLIKTDNWELTPLPENAVVTMVGGRVLRTDNGEVLLKIDIGTPYQLKIDLSALNSTDLTEGGYTLYAELRPQASLQSKGGTHDGANATAQSSVTYNRATDSGAKRSISATTSGGRLIDASKQAAALALDLELRGVQSGDTLGVEVLKKTGTTPEDSSYSAVNGWAVSPDNGHALSGNSETLTITVPQSTESGTYRAKLTVISADGNIVAEEKYNFIVK